jgi:hypothetical protein
MGITYGPSKREIVNYRNMLLDTLALEQEEKPAVPNSARSPRGDVEGLSPEAEAEAQATELMMCTMARDLDIVMEDNASGPNSPKKRSGDDSPNASIEEPMFFVGEYVLLFVWLFVFCLFRLLVCLLYLRCVCD